MKCNFRRMKFIVKMDPTRTLSLSLNTERRRSPHVVTAPWRSAAPHQAVCLQQPPSCQQRCGVYALAPAHRKG